jgi:23S rRNA (uracil1939-C5)-methyltransferase
MARKKHPIIEKLAIEKIAAEGKSLGYFQDKVVFVEGTAPGDIVDVQIHKRKKNFLEGRAMKNRPYELNLFVSTMVFVAAVNGNI